MIRYLLRALSKSLLTKSPVSKSSVSTSPVATSLVTMLRSGTLSVVTSLVIALPVIWGGLVFLCVTSAHAGLQVTDPKPQPGELTPEAQAAFDKARPPIEPKNPLLNECSGGPPTFSTECLQSDVYKKWLQKQIKASKVRSHMVCNYCAVSPSPDAKISNFFQSTIALLSSRWQILRESFTGDIPALPKVQSQLEGLEMFIGSPCEPEDSWHRAPTRQCILASQKQAPGAGWVGTKSKYLKCFKNKNDKLSSATIPVMQRRMCRTQKNVELIYQSFHDVADCLGFRTEDKKVLFALFNNESKFMNAQSHTGAQCMGQLTTVGIDDVKELNTGEQGALEKYGAIAIKDNKWPAGRACERVQAHIKSTSGGEVASKSCNLAHNPYNCFVYAMQFFQITRAHARKKIHFIHSDRLQKVQHRVLNVWFQNKATISKDELKGITRPFYNLPIGGDKKHKDRLKLNRLSGHMARFINRHSDEKSEFTRNDLRKLMDDLNFRDQILENHAETGKYIDTAALTLFSHLENDPNTEEALLEKNNQITDILAVWGYNAGPNQATSSMASYLNVSEPFPEYVECVKVHSQPSTPDSSSGAGEGSEVGVEEVCKQYQPSIKGFVQNYSQYLQLKKRGLSKEARDYSMNVLERFDKYLNPSNKTEAGELLKDWFTDEDYKACMPTIVKEFLQPPQ